MQLASVPKLLTCSVLSASGRSAMPIIEELDRLSQPGVRRRARKNRIPLCL